jgi:hypothetical protein
MKRLCHYVFDRDLVDLRHSITGFTLPCHRSPRSCFCIGLSWGFWAKASWKALNKHPWCILMWCMVLHGCRMQSTATFSICACASDLASCIRKKIDSGGAGTHRDFNWPKLSSWLRQQRRLQELTRKFKFMRVKEHMEERCDPTWPLCNHPSGISDTLYLFT